MERCELPGAFVDHHLPQCCNFCVLKLSTELQIRVRCVIDLALRSCIHFGSVTSRILSNPLEWSNLLCILYLYYSNRRNRRRQCTVSTINSTHTHTRRSMTHFPPHRWLVDTKTNEAQRIHNPAIFFFDFFILEGHSR